MRKSIFCGTKRWGIIISGILLSTLLLAACDNLTPNTLDPKGPTALSESNLFWFILIVATIVFVAVEGVLLYSIIRYRERPNSPAPAQIHGNNTVEIIWTVAPSLFLFAVLIGTIYTMFQIQRPKTPDVEIQAIGHQWWWEFKYVHENITTADEIHVPMGGIVQVDLVSNNVIHSFWVPQLSGKLDDIPGHDNRLWFKADQTGKYLGECAEFCGIQHAHMNFYVIVDQPNSYSTWVTTQQQNAASPSGSLATAGLNLFKGSAGCAGCHGIVGVNLTGFNDPKANALIGPNLTHFGNRRAIAGDVVEWDPVSCAIVGDHLANKDNCNLYKWLQNPQAVKEGNDMAIRSLSDTEITQLIAYLESLQ